MNATSEAPGVAAVSAPSGAKTICANCGTELLGPHCYACGQPVKGMVRHLGSILHDMADTVLNIDSRIFRTLLPLYFRPGFLSTEYFAGRRVRYVTPFRLYFFLSVAAFLLIQVSFDSSIDDARARGVVHFDLGDDDIAAALTPAEVEARRDAAIAAVEKTRAAGLPDAAAKKLDRAEEKIRERAKRRLEKLDEIEKAKASGAPLPAADDDSGFTIDGKNWDPEKDPIAISWLPAFANAKLTALAKRMKENIPRIQKDPKPFLLGGVAALPQVLFVLMPLFALLLKIFYIFKRRLYMEHLIVALHSHSFIFLSIILITLASLARSWAETAAQWLTTPLGWLVTLMGWWLPIYLFVMQKKVYRQGWFFTTVKYGTIGICYTIMISIGIMAAFMVSLATT